MGSQLNKAIKLTLSYASFFNFPLTQSELHFWLISSKQFSQKQINKAKLLPSKTGSLRIQRKKYSQQKIKTAQKLASLLKAIPTVQLVALTGSLAMENANSDDDIDLMIITTPNTLWLTRPLVLLLVALFYKRRKPNHKKTHHNAICLNLWIDTKALAVPKSKRNLYTAHEVLQVKPLFSKQSTYQFFIEANFWTKQHLANAYSSLTSEFKQSKTPLPNKIFSLIPHFPNVLAFRLQYLYMKSKITQEHITLHSAYFHPRNLTKNILNHLKG